MQPLAAHELLEVWETGVRLSPVRRALLLLAASCPEAVPSELEHLSIGERDARLLQLRAWSFGSRLEGLAVCPYCHERLEVTLEVDDLLRNAPLKANDAMGQDDRVLACCGENYELRFRLPNSLDLLAIEGEVDEVEAARLLLQRCLLENREKEKPCPDKVLGAEAVQAVLESLGQADPLADLRLALNCPACQGSWESPLDIATFFWKEIEAWAHRLLRQIHVLAGAYGWREQDILSMSAWRRHYYLNLLGG
jgi:hypothetical protein